MIGVMGSVKVIGVVVGVGVIVIMMMIASLVTTVGLVIVESVVYGALLVQYRWQILLIPVIIITRPPLIATVDLIEGKREPLCIYNVLSILFIILLTYSQQYPPSSSILHLLQHPDISQEALNPILTGIDLNMVDRAVYTIVYEK